MRRTHHLRMLAATLFTACAALVPMAAAPAAAVQTASVDRHYQDDYPPGGLGPAAVS
jgi:D-alanyl-D-alanine carboxypeptidase